MLSPKASEKTQQTMLVFWLLELHLTELGEAKSGTLSNSAIPGPPIGNWSTFQPQTQSQFPPSGAVMGKVGQMESKGTFDHSKYRLLRDQFRLFLGKPVVLECLKSNSDAVYQVMTSHGDADSCLYFADLMKDYERVLSLHVQQEHFDEALHVLRKQQDAALYYKFSPSLMGRAPRRLVDAWIAARGALNPKLLLPAMFHCDREKDTAEEAIRYMEYCVSSLNSGEPALHNYLISLYSRFCPDKLLGYLQSRGTDPQQIPYDPKYALRLSSEKNLHKASIHLYNTLGLYEEAVDLALRTEVDLAKECAKQREDGVDGKNEEMRKKLWLQIARHVVEKEQNIEQCMELLQESQGLIKIQDILPFFPDFATIDNFKNSLCACLKERSGKIQELQKEMKEATEVAEDIRKDMNKLRNSSHVIKLNDCCAACQDPVLIRALYSFPCGHNFHADCLERQLAPYLAEESLDKLGKLKTQLANATELRGSASTADVGGSYNRSTPQASGGGDAASPQKTEQQLRREIDALLAAECPWCGDFIINTIDQPFYSPSEYLKELKTWDVPLANDR